MGGEDRTDLADRAFITRAVEITMKQGQYGALQFIEQRLAMGFRRVAFGADGPSLDAFDAAVNPLAIQHAQA